MPLRKTARKAWAIGSGVAMRLILVAALVVVLAGCASQPRLGAIDFPISCSRPAQVEFNRAVALLHHMFMEQGHAADALAAYRRALDLYPNRLNSTRGAARAE